jgi:hypothetical protein
MRELFIAIGFNVLVGVLTTLLIYFYWTRKRRTAPLPDAETALGLFRDHFPEANGTTTVTTDGRNALIDLADGVSIGLLQGHGHRWNAHWLKPGDVASVRVSQETKLQVKFTDYGSPRASLLLTDANERAAWLARLQALTRSAQATRRGDVSHA